MRAHNTSDLTQEQHLVRLSQCEAAVAHLWPGLLCGQDPAYYSEMRWLETCNARRRPRNFSSNRFFRF